MGLEPDTEDADYGWIVPNGRRAGARGVEAFVEKPNPIHAHELWRRGGVWNSFLFAARAKALVSLVDKRLPGLVQKLSEIVHGADAERIYAELPSNDFSRDVLEGSESDLALVSVAPCGWTDLGTPSRVAKCLRALDSKRGRPRVVARAPLTLAAALSAGL